MFGLTLSILMVIFSTTCLICTTFNIPVKPIGISMGKSGFYMDGKPYTYVVQWGFIGFNIRVWMFHRSVSSTYGNPDYVVISGFGPIFHHKFYVSEGMTIKDLQRIARDRKNESEQT